jgi:FkbM family methyltransferase
MSSVRSIGKAVNHILGPLGVEIRKTSKPPTQKLSTAVNFYRPHASCQIPELADLYKQILGERSNGTFVEVGAYDGISYSNSSCLAEVGWSGVLIEPVPAYANACREKYAGNTNVRVIEVAAGAGESMIELAVAGAFTTSNKKLMEAYRGIEWAASDFAGSEVIMVRQRMLDAILDDAGVTSPIGVLIVDVEGNEADVFAGFDIDRWRPLIMIVELAHTHPDLHSVSPNDAQIQRQICEHGYSVIYKNFINTVFARDL